LPQLTSKYNLKVLHPNVARDWHSTKNGALTPNDVTPGSKKKVWWKCSKGHEWESVVGSRVTGGRNNKYLGCPFCSGKRLHEGNSLLILFPDIAKEWHPTKNGNLQPNQITGKNNQKVWWLCSRKHEWEAPPNNRVRKIGGKCPYCSNKLVGKDNNFLVEYPQISNEWHPTKNGNLQPNQITGKSNRKIWWLCRKNSKHYWQAVVNKRTVRGDGCPHCNPQTSKIEIRVYCELKTIWEEAIWRFKLDGIECDIYLPSYKIAIEVDGYPWHLGREKNDSEKEKKLSRKGVRLFRVRDEHLERISSTDIFFKENKNQLLLIKELVENIKHHFSFSNDENAKIESYLTSKTLKGNKEFKEIISCLPGPIPEKSLVRLHPKISKEWNFKKNAPMLPILFPPGSNLKVWWKCEKGHEWQQQIDKRTVRGQGCPYCSGRNPTPENNLLLKYPDIAKEWHPTKNGCLTAKDFTPKSSKKAWWVCPHSSLHEWESSICNRVNGNGCPFCTGKKVCLDNNLLFLFPEISKEWHPTKNGNLTPKDVVPGSGKKVWWQCKNGHEWETRIASKSRGSGCPYCANQRVSEDNNLFLRYPDVAKEWHPTKNGNLTPKDVMPGSNKKVWWQCKNGHEWETRIASKSRGSGCPYCRNKKRGHVISRKTLKKKGSLFQLFPDVAKEWHPTKNGNLTPKVVVAGSDKKVWWQCKKGHEWETRVANKSRGRGCPYCANQRVSEDNNLLIKHPDIAKEWHPTKNGDMSPKNSIPGSGKKVWWQCKNGHEWEATIHNRSKDNGTGCPSCYFKSNKGVPIIKAAIKRSGNLKDKSPLVAKEWHPNKNAPLEPIDITSGSKKKVWWKCKKEHEWEAVINSRTKGSGCPHCWRERSKSGSNKKYE
jgi:hypothetical protein